MLLTLRTHEWGPDLAILIFTLVSKITCERVEGRQPNLFLSCSRAGISRIRVTFVSVLGDGLIVNSAVLNVSLTVKLYINCRFLMFMLV